MLHTNVAIICSKRLSYFSLILQQVVFHVASVLFERFVLFSRDEPGAVDRSAAVGGVWG
jgi:hypothetical protein